MRFLSLLFLTISTFGLLTSAQTSGLTIALIDEKNFCQFLPNVPNGLIGFYEKDAQAFCTTAIPQAPGALIFPTGFITVAHFLKGPSYVQVTGGLNSQIYVVSNDEGGQFDHKDSPPNGSCVGYPYFVNLVEPAAGRFCIRCCQDAADCPIGQSTFGCPVVLPGDYDGISTASVSPFAINANVSGSSPSGANSTIGTNSTGSPSASPSSALATFSSLRPVSILFSIVMAFGFWKL